MSMLNRRAIDIEADSLWIEKPTAYTPLDVVRVFQASPGYMPHRAVAFTIIDGRNAKVGDPRNRRVFTLDAFLERFERFRPEADDE